MIFCDQNRGVDFWFVHDVMICAQLENKYAIPIHDVLFNFINYTYLYVQLYIKHTLTNTLKETLKTIHSVSYVGVNKTDF